MSTQNPQETLNRLLADLKSEAVERQLSALHELTMLEFSSEAIVRQLEKLALQADGPVKKFAFEALDLQTSQLVASRTFSLPKPERELILREVNKLKEAELLHDRQAEIISRRYDFDLRPGIPARPRVVTPQPAPTPEAEPEPDQPVIAEAEPAPSVVAQPQPVQPRPSLTQVLLSETSIRIYLYLGAFFVIASAAILAALVEAARLPVLLIATLAFAGGAVGFKKRLPQPSFAFAIVFSFLLPIDAGVIADNLNLAVRADHGYWSLIFVLMAACWAAGTWFYESRLFSMASFAALTLGALRAVNALELATSWSVFATGLISLLGWFGASTLKEWRTVKFAQPLILATQLVQILTLAYSAAMLLINLFDPQISADGWLAQTLTWLFAAAFYALSRTLFPFVLFPWMSAGSLFLVPALLLSAFDASATAYSVGFGLWGALLAFASEAAHRSKYAELGHYHFPWLALSLPLFLVAIPWGFSENFQLGFAAFLGTAVVYTLLNIGRARWYVWTAALLAGLGAYFTFFALPFMQNVEVYFGYQLLGASLLLLVPELFFKEPLTTARPWNVPPFGLGVLVTALNLWGVFLNLLGNNAYAFETALILGIYAALFAAYALHFKQPLLGYLATASLTVALYFALLHYQVDWWLPVFTGLAVMYYLAGFLLARRETVLAWGSMLLRSGLVLGVLISSYAVVTLEPVGSWYVLVITLMFMIELFTRRDSRLEFLALALASGALIIFLDGFRIREFAYYLFGVGLIWLIGDAALHLTLSERKVDLATKGIGALLTLAAVMQIVVVNELASAATVACFAVYTAFFAAYALIYKAPPLGYLSTAAAAITMFYALEHFHIETWLPIFTGLVLVYYGTGFFLRTSVPEWSRMFRYSGLALGGVVSLVALVSLEATGGWYALIVGGLFVLETRLSRNGWFEAGVYIPMSVAAFLILRDLDLRQEAYTFLALSLVWLGGDVIFEKTFKDRKVANFVRLIGGGITVVNVLSLWFYSPYAQAAICFSVYTVFFAVYAWLYGRSLLGYAATAALPLAILFTFRATDREGWLFALIAVAVLYYLLKYFVSGASSPAKWDELFLYSGLGLGTLVALAAPFQAGGVGYALPIAVAATLFAAEAYTRRNVWLAFPANGLYLLSYFVLLVRLDVDEPQYFSIGAAVLGMLMHYLLVQAKSKVGAFSMGMLSQLVLLGTTYIQMVSTSRLSFFFILFVQSLLVLAYGIVMRSRSLVIAPIGFAVLGVVTVLYSALKDLSLVVIIGVTGLILLSLGILAVVMRERITTLAERFSDWEA